MSDRIRGGLEALGALLDLVAPPVCPACDAPRPARASLLCAGCAEGLRKLRSQRGVRTAFAYEGTARRLIRRLKFEGRRDGLPILVAGLAERVARARFDAIVPVPRHWRRVREAGSDPVYDLARGLARATGRRLVPDVLVRTRPTPPQTGLSPPARRRNVRGSFRASSGLRGRRILCLDDVLTTGATIEAAARALRRAGAARSVLRAAVAATPLPGPRPRAL